MRIIIAVQCLCSSFSTHSEHIIYSFMTTNTFCPEAVLAGSRFDRQPFGAVVRPCALHRRRRNAAVRSDEAEAAKLRSWRWKATARSWCGCSGRQMTLGSSSERERERAGWRASPAARRPADGNFDDFRRNFDAPCLTPARADTTPIHAHAETPPRRKLPAARRNRGRKFGTSPLKLRHYGARSRLWFFRVSCNQPNTRGQYYKLYQQFANCTSRPNFFSERVVTLWNSLRGDRVNFSFLHKCKSSL